METITSLIRRLTRVLGSRGTRTGTQETTASGSPRDFTQERETSRMGNLSAEDQAWEADRRQRDLAAREGDQRPPGSS